jgi:hypothetical protein
MNYEDILQKLTVSRRNVLDKADVREKEENEESDLGIFVRRVYLAIQSSPVVSLTSDESCAYIYVVSTRNRQTNENRKRGDRIEDDITVDIIR